MDNGLCALKGERGGKSLGGKKTRYVKKKGNETQAPASKRLLMKKKRDA